MSKVIITIDVYTDDDEEIAVVHESTSTAVEAMMSMFYVMSLVTSEVKD